MSIRVLIVDDSAFMRVAIRKMIESETRIEIVGEARSGKEGLELAIKLKPDVITMDIEMPDMNGVEATAAIMKQAPASVIMVSSLTQQGAKATFEAMDAGAVDYISKSSSFVQLDIVEIERDLINKIVYWSEHRRRTPASPTRVAVEGAPSTRPAPVGSDYGIAKPAYPPPVPRPRMPSSPPEVVVIGVSTGGPRQFIEVLGAMPVLNCPVIVAQHMGAAFTGGFAEHLARKSGHNVIEGKDRMTLSPGDVVICPGGQNSRVERAFDKTLRLRVSPDPKVVVYPSVDLLFESAAAQTRSGVGVVLTGMGSDGAKGSQDMAAKGMPILAQIPDTCIVGGMPESAIRTGCVSQTLGLAEIGVALGKMASSNPFNKPVIRPAAY